MKTQADLDAKLTELANALAKVQPPQPATPADFSTEVSQVQSMIDTANNLSGTGVTNPPPAPSIG